MSRNSVIGIPPLGVCEARARVAESRSLVLMVVASSCVGGAAACLASLPGVVVLVGPYGAGACFAGFAAGAVVFGVGAAHHSMRAVYWRKSAGFASWNLTQQQRAITSDVVPVVSRDVVSVQVLDLDEVA